MCLIVEYYFLSTYRLKKVLENNWNKLTMQKMRSPFSLSYFRIVYFSFSFYYFVSLFFTTRIFPSSFHQRLCLYVLLAISAVIIIGKHTNILFECELVLAQRLIVFCRNREHPTCKELARSNPCVPGLSALGQGWLLREEVRNSDLPSWQALKEQLLPFPLFLFPQEKITEGFVS